MKFSKSTKVAVSGIQGGTPETVAIKAKWSTPLLRSSPVSASTLLLGGECTDGVGPNGLVSLQLGQSICPI